jgi:hypothetical protein
MAQMTAVNDGGKTDESTGAGLRLCEFGVKNDGRNMFSRVVGVIEAEKLARPG